MAITVAQAKNLRLGQTLYHTIHRNADGTPERWRVNGKPKTWKRIPGAVSVPVKRGLREYGYLDAWCMDLLCLTEAEAIEGS